MKKRLLIFVVLFLLLPCVINASYDFNKSLSVSKSNESLCTYKNYSKYILNGYNLPYVYDNNGLSVDNNNIYNYNALLNLYEYTVAGGNLSYFRTGDTFWTMTNYNEDSTYCISENDTSIISNNDTSRIRPTVFVKKEVTVEGIGTRVDPWVFVGIEEHNLTFNLGTTYGGSFSSDFELSRSMEVGSSITVPDPVSDDYLFDGWTPNLLDSNKVFTMGDSDVVMTALWKRKNYKLTINLGGGTFTGGESTSYDLPTNGNVTLTYPTKGDSAFTGWTITSTTNDSSISGTKFTMGTSDTTLTAKWENVNTAYTAAGSYTYAIKVDGIYQINLCGAQGGGTPNYSSSGGLGACVSGRVRLTAGNTLYVNIGGAGYSVSGWATGGFNGGGTGGACYAGHPTGNGSGGGASDVRYNSTATSSRIIVAGGGGGGEVHGFNGGAAGGLSGYSGCCDRGCSSGGGQSTGSSGVGGAGCASGHGTGGGGGGYNGGEARCDDNSGAGWGVPYYPGGGGSSFISGHPGCITVSGLTFTNTSMIDGAGYSWTSSIGSKVGSGHSGNGNGSITYVSP